ncbi:alpha/beta hydrolase fold domain-containing protein [Nocardia sienata]|uniref:alpha/beta hydrolase fold domain-containing protein n=1 Tax=Nocardia sienata TaxID=248552 RepID=UPI000A5523DE|nr:alpha/beta hydrolase fold domain-containing protein [Nocardia sienata]
MRILTRLRPTPDWDSITPEQFVEFRAAQDRLRGSVLLRPLTGRPDRAARIADHTVDLPGRRLNVRVYRPERESSPLPLVIAFHGGGLVSGAPDQDDWLLAHLAVHSPAVVASLDYRLAPEHPVPAPVQDAYEAVPRLVDSAARWGADRDRLALLGSSAGATLAALTAIRAAELGLGFRAQVLINPQLDWTDRAFEYPSFTENADSPTASPAECRAVARIAVPESFDRRTISPMYSEGLQAIAPALILAAGLDPLEDQSAAYADRLRCAGVEVMLSRYPEATHAFLSMPGAVPAARPARAEILDHLRHRLAGPPRGGQRSTPPAPGRRVRR